MKTMKNKKIWLGMLVCLVVFSFTSCEDEILTGGDGTVVVNNQYEYTITDILGVPNGGTLFRNISILPNTSQAFSFFATPERGSTIEIFTSDPKFKLGDVRHGTASSSEIVRMEHNKTTTITLTSDGKVVVENP